MYFLVVIDGSVIFFFGWKRRLGVFIKLNGFKNKLMFNIIDFLYNVFNN